MPRKVRLSVIKKNGTKSSWPGAPKRNRNAVKSGFWASLSHSTLTRGQRLREPGVRLKQVSSMQLVVTPALKKSS